MKAIKKFFKFIFWTAFWILMVVAVAALTIPLWVGPVVTRAANWKVPSITGTRFHLGEFELNPYTGRLHIGDMQLENPESFYTAYKAKAKDFSEVKGEGILDAAWEHTKNIGTMAGDMVATVGDALASSETNAVSFSAIDVKFDTLSFASDNIHIEEVVIKDLYFYGDLTFSNIREIAENAKNGGKGAEPKAEEPKAEEPAPSPETPAPEAKNQKKVVIDRIFITGARMQWGHVAVNLPDIEIKDVGKDKAMSGKEIFYKVVDAICEAADMVAKGAGSALKVAIEGVGSLGEVLSGGVDTAKDIVGSGVETVTNILGGAGGDLKEVLPDAETAKAAVSSGMEAASSVVSGGVEAASGVVSDGVKAASGVVSGGVEAIGSGIGSALNFISGSKEEKQKK